MPDKDEVQHNYGTPITNEPGSVRELFKMFLDLAGRVDKLENVPPVPPAPPQPEEPPAQ